MINKIFSFINFIFSFEWKIQQKIMKLHVTKSKIINLISRVSGILLIIILCFITLIVKQFNTISLIIVGTLAMFCLLTEVISKSLKALTTISGFFTTGLGTIIIIFLLAFVALMENHEAISSLNETIVLNEYIEFDYVGYLFSLIIFAFIWNIFSSLCNTKIATLCNAIITAIVGLLIELKNVIFLFLPSKIGFFDETELVEIEVLGYSETQLFDLAISLFIFPIFATLGIATIVCAIKSYWIKKYNDGCDIEDVDNETDLENMENNVEAVTEEY